MKEFALMSAGRVVNIVTTSRPLSEMKIRYDTFEVVPIMQVPHRALVNYQYWAVRP